jgi:hypothetical protein
MDASECVVVFVSDQQVEDFDTMLDSDISDYGAQHGRPV